MEPYSLIREDLQPSLNIGCIGHVSHGKSSIVKALTGIGTAKFDDELEKNMTIKLGYANAKIWYCNFCKLYFSTNSNIMIKDITCDKCLGECELKRHISFVDVPGHEILMSTMLNGSAIMDAALIVIAANEPCPQPQTHEHLVSLDMLGITKHITIQNKIDLVTVDNAKDNYNAIKSFVGKSKAHNSPIIPICANKNLNVDILCEYISKINIPEKNIDASPLMIIVRSFDINKPGTPIKELQGGVVGGSLLKGTLSIGQNIEIRPGIIHKNKDGSFSCEPIITEVISLASENNSLECAYPGGLIAVCSLIDPYYTKSDRLVGNIIGIKGNMPSIYSKIEISYVLIPRNDNDDIRIAKIGKNEVLRLNIGSLTVDAKVLALKADLLKLELVKPACIINKSKISLSRNFKKNSGWRLVGVGLLCNGDIILE